MWDNTTGDFAALLTVSFDVYFVENATILKSVKLTQLIMVTIIVISKNNTLIMMFRYLKTKHMYEKCIKIFSYICRENKVQTEKYLYFIVPKTLIKYKITFLDLATLSASKSINPSL